MEYLDYVKPKRSRIKRKREELVLDWKSEENEVVADL